MRFNELARAIDAPNPPVLSNLLKKAQRDGTVERHVHTLGPPPAISYSLTQLGRELAKPASELLSRIEEHRAEIEGSRARHLVAAPCDPVSPRTSSTAAAASHTLIEV
jgi:DNA-binding HxlR family transcriptional regulator